VEIIESWLRDGLEDALQGALQWSLGHVWQIALVIAIVCFGVALFRAHTHQKKSQWTPGPGAAYHSVCPMCGGPTHPGRKCGAP
jgi:hypothetical protein